MLVRQTPFFRGREGVISCHDHADYMDAISFFPARQRFHLQMKETRGMLIVGILLIRQKERARPTFFDNLKNPLRSILLHSIILLEGF